MNGLALDVHKEEIAVEMNLDIKKVNYILKISQDIVSAKILDIEIDKKAAENLSKCARRTPRIANRLLRRMRDFAEIQHDGIITDKVVSQSLDSLSIDEKGLDYSDQQYLQLMCENFSGGPTGLSTIAAAMGEEENTIEEVIEPFLIMEGMIQKTPRGRQVTDKGWNHLGLKNTAVKEIPNNTSFDL